MSKQKREPFSAEIQQRAIRLVREQTPQHASKWAAITAIARKLGCTKGTLRRGRARPWSAAGGGFLPGDGSAQLGRAWVVRYENQACQVPPSKAAQRYVAPGRRMLIRQKQAGALPLVTVSPVDQREAL